MGRKPRPGSIRWHKFKNPESLLTRANEKVAGGVFERPEWFDAYQRYPIDIQDMHQHMFSPQTKELLEDQKNARVPRQHPAQALLDRMMERRPSFSAAVYEEDGGEENMTQKYFNRMYELLEEGVPEEKAFSKCDSEFKGELIDYEKSLTSRTVSKDARSGVDTARSILEEAITAEEMKLENTTGFSLGKGRFYSPIPFGADDIAAYEKEVAMLYDRSKFSWAHDWEGQISKLLRMGITEREMKGIQSEMRFATDNALKQSSDSITAKAFKLSLGAWIFENRTESTAEKLSLEEHRELCHRCLYVEAARARAASQLRTVTPGETHATTLKIILGKLRQKDHLRKALQRVGLLDQITDKVMALMEAERLKAASDKEGGADEGDHKTAKHATDQDASSLQSRVRALGYLERTVLESDADDDTANMILREASAACGLSPLPEEKGLEDFLTGKLKRPELCSLDSSEKEQFDHEAIRVLQKQTSAMDPVLQYAEEIIADMEHLQAQGDPPQSGRVKRCFMALQKISEFTEEVQMQQHGKIFTLDDVLEARDLYRATITDGYNPVDHERLMLSDVWDEIELLERYHLLNQTIQPTLTISQFNRIADSEAFLSKLIPMQDPVAYKRGEDSSIDLLYEVGYGRLSNADIQHAILVNRIFPARIRSYIFRKGRQPRRVRPFLNFNKELEIEVAQDLVDGIKYSAHGGKDRLEPEVNAMLYNSLEACKRQRAKVDKLVAQWEAAEKRFGVAAKEDNNDDDEQSKAATTTTNA